VGVSQRKNKGDDRERENFARNLHPGMDQKAIGRTQKNEGLRNTSACIEGVVMMRGPKKLEKKLAGTRGKFPPTEWEQKGETIEKGSHSLGHEDNPEGQKNFVRKRTENKNTKGSVGGGEPGED